jgi:flagellar basal body-associated protein FliL
MKKALIIIGIVAVLLIFLLVVGVALFTIVFGDDIAGFFTEGSVNEFAEDTKTDLANSELTQKYVYFDNYQVYIPDDWIENPDETELSDIRVTAGVKNKVYADFYEFTGYTFEEDKEAIKDYLGDGIMSETSLELEGYSAYQYAYRTTLESVYGEESEYMGYYTIIDKGDGVITEINAYYIVSREPADEDLQLLEDLTMTFTIIK